MATDDGDPGDEDLDDGDTSDEHLRTLIREELSAALDGFKAPDVTPKSDDGGDTSSMSVRDIEAATERAVRKAMDDLAKKASRSRQSKPPAKPKADPEPTPDAPPTTIFDKIKKAAWS